MSIIWCEIDDDTEIPTISTLDEFLMIPTYHFEILKGIKDNNLKQED